MLKKTNRAQTLTNGAGERASPIRGGHCARLTLSHPHSHDAIPSPVSTPQLLPSAPKIPTISPPPPWHAAAGTRCAGKSPAPFPRRHAHLSDRTLAACVVRASDQIEQTALFFCQISISL